MKRFLAVILLFLILPAQAMAGSDEVLSAVIENAELDEARKWSEELMPDRDFGETLIGIAKGELTIDGNALLSKIFELLFSSISGSAAALLSALAPIVLYSLLTGTENSGRLTRMRTPARLTILFITSLILSSNIAGMLSLCYETVGNLSSCMQSIFPVMLTIMSAVGSVNSSSLLKPALVAACGSMTAIITHVSLPLVSGAAMLSVAGSVSPRFSLTRLCALLRNAAAWTLGMAVTVFMGVTAISGLTGASLDGVMLRGAKYTIDQFVPVIGGMLSETLETILGSVLLIKNGIGVMGIVLLLLVCIGPILQTAGAALLYTASAALLEPIADEAPIKMLDGFGKVLSMLFLLELGTLAMFIMLLAQVMASMTLGAGVS